MRKNTKEAFTAWLNGTPWRKADSIWTDGERLMSYGTCLVEHKDGLVFNTTRYSVTTSIQQGGLRHLLAEFYPVTEVSGIPIGTRNLPRAEALKYREYPEGAPRLAYSASRLDSNRCILREESQHYGRTGIKPYQIS